MKTRTLEYIALSDLFEGLPHAKTWFGECDWRDFTWGDTSHAMLPAKDLLRYCGEENEDDPSKDPQIAREIRQFINRMVDISHMMIDLAT